MLRRKNSASLPTTLPNSPAGQTKKGLLSSFQNDANDGSGRAIKMDAPLVKSWKQSSKFTKYSYYFLAFFIVLMFMGYKFLRYWNASIWLTCHQHECTLEITPSGSRTRSVVFPRTQLDNAQQIKTDKAGNFLSIDTEKYVVHARGAKNKKKKGSYKGPDENGEYKSFSLKFKKKTPDDVERPEGMVDSDFEIVRQYLEEEGDVFVLHMRKFGLSQSRTRVRSSINKVESYNKRRRQKLIIKESATLPWQGILCLIFGLLGTMLTLLIGQFWDETPNKYGGPGSRRSTTSTRQSMKKDQANFVVNTGRPAKYPPGYQSKRFK